MDTATPPVSPERYSELAARSETCPREWQSRFTRMLMSGAVRMPVPPGLEAAAAVIAPGAAQHPEQTALRCAERVRRARGGHKPGPRVGFDLSVMSAPRPDRWLARFEGALAGYLPGIALERFGLLFSIDSGHPAAVDVLRLRQSSRLGYPAVALRYPGHAPERIYELAVRSYEDTRLHLIPNRSVRPLSALHGLEPGECVLPCTLLEARSDTAWMVLELDACALRNAPATRQLIRVALRFADNLIDQIDWRGTAMQLDAMLNRRVSLQLAGLGDLIRQRGLAPESFAALSFLRRFVRFVRRCLVHESMLLARHRGPFAGLRAGELIAELAPRYGAAHARHLIRNRCLRHRHLLALSPFDVLPTEPQSIRDGRWLGLIPALACADVISMRGSSRRARLKVHEWARLLQLTAALPEHFGNISSNTP